MDAEWQRCPHSTHDACPAPIPPSPGSTLELMCGPAHQCSSAKPRVERPPKTCNYCGSLEHLHRACTLGSSLRREQQFLQCSPQCFVRRFVCPLHRARLDFDLGNLCEGRVDVAGRLVTAALVASQRVRHNTELFMPFLGDEPASTVVVTGGLVRSLHPSEVRNAARIRRAVDELPVNEPATSVEGWEHSPVSPLPREQPPELRGFRLIRGGLEGSLREALTLARADGSAAPLLLLVQGAPPLQAVLAEHGPSLRDLVCVLGDDIGITDDEVQLCRRLGAEAGGGGPVLTASLGGGCLLASQCIVILHHYLDALHDCPARLWEGGSEVKRNMRQRRRQLQRGSQGGVGTPVRYLPFYTNLCRLEAALGSDSGSCAGSDEDKDEESGSASSQASDRVAGCETES